MSALCRSALARPRGHVLAGNGGTKRLLHPLEECSSSPQRLTWPRLWRKRAPRMLYKFSSYSFRNGVANIHEDAGSKVLHYVGIWRSHLTVIGKRIDDFWVKPTQNLRPLGTLLDRCSGCFATMLVLHVLSIPAVSVYDKFSGSEQPLAANFSLA